MAVFVAISFFMIQKTELLVENCPFKNIAIQDTCVLVRGEMPKYHIMNIGLQVDPNIPSRYWHESPICDKLTHQKRCSEATFFS